MPKRKNSVMVQEEDDLLPQPSSTSQAPAKAREASAAATAAAPTAGASSAAAAAAAASGGAALSKQERKRLKKQRQKEEKRKREAGDGAGSGGGEPSAAAAAGAAAAAKVEDIDDIFDARQPAGASGDDGEVGTVPIFAEGDGDGYVSDGEGGVVARDMDDLEQIFAERREKAAASARASAAGAAAAAAASAAQERDAYVTGKGGKDRRLVDGLAVYSEDEMQKMALADVKGKLDGPCPFECSCCF
jgi:hypothetical protein